MSLINKTILGIILLLLSLSPITFIQSQTEGLTDIESALQEIDYNKFTYEPNVLTYLTEDEEALAQCYFYLNEDESFWILELEVFTASPLMNEYHNSTIHVLKYKTLKAMVLFLDKMLPDNCSTIQFKTHSSNLNIKILDSYYGRYYEYYFTDIEWENSITLFDVIYKYNENY